MLKVIDISQPINQVSEKILDSAFKIHRLYGPGLLESAEAQLLTYMKLSGKQIGLLINFNVTLLKNGVKRFVL